MDPVCPLKYGQYNTLLWEESFSWLRNAAGPLDVPLINYIVHYFRQKLQCGSNMCKIFYQWSWKSIDQLFIHDIFVTKFLEYLGHYGIREMQVDSFSKCLDLNGDGIHHYSFLKYPENFW